jgi:hypothetical protein
MPPTTKHREADAETKPVALQINTAGGWRNVIKFDAANDEDSTRVMKHAPPLATIGSATLRIVTDDGLQQCLTAWDIKRGWYDFKTGAPLR